MRLRSGTVANPNAGGTLADVPLSNALLYIRNKKLSGVLDLRAPGGRHGWIVTWRGRVVTATTTPPVARFGAVAYELGFIDAETLDASATRSEREQRSHAEILLEAEVISNAQLQKTLEEQTCRRVHHMFTFADETLFLFREGRPSSVEPQITIDLLAPVWRGLSDHPPSARIAKIVEAIGNRPIQMVSESALERAGFSRAEATVCEQLARGPMTLATLKQTARLPADRVELLVYLLVLARCAEVMGHGHAVVPSSAMWAAAARPPRPAPTTSGTISTQQAAHVSGPRELGIEGIRHRAEHLAEESPYQLLGLDENTSHEAARAAFFRLSRLWNPDKLPADLEEVRDQVTQIWNRMGEAHRSIVEGENRTAKG